MKYIFFTNAYAANPMINAAYPKINDIFLMKYIFFTNAYAANPMINAAYPKINDIFLMKYIFFTSAYAAYPTQLQAVKFKAYLFKVSKIEDKIKKTS